MSGWVRFENTMPENLKTAPITDRAFRLWIHSACYCSRNETDGLVPAAVVCSLSRTATKRSVDELVNARLFEVVLDGYLVHDYLEYNPSRARIRELKDAAKKRTARWRGSPGDEDVTHHTTGNSRITSHARDRTGPIPSDPSSSPSGKESKLGREPSRRADPHVLPEMDEDLGSRARHLVLPILALVQAERGGDVPTLRGVGLAVRRYPDRDHWGIAAELEHWALAGRGQGKPVKDWVRTYATFLERAPAGKPTQAGRVVPLRASEAVERMNDYRHFYPQESAS